MEKQQKINSGFINQTSIKCQKCSLFNSCLPKSLTNPELEIFENSLQQNPPLEEGRHLFISGDKLNSLFIIRNGSCLSYSHSGGDALHSNSRYFSSGKILGLNAIAGGFHPTSTKTNEISSFCEISYHVLISLCFKLPSLQKQLIKMTNIEISEDQSSSYIFYKKIADNRRFNFLQTKDKRVEIK